MMDSIPAGVISKLAQNLHFIPEAGCHIYAGNHRKKGYGVIHSTHRKYATHRVAWIIANGAIPDGMCVMHKCDTPSCCNPEHLRLGSNQDNIDDAVAKGRRFTKLTPSQVIEIREGSESIRSLARRLCVARSTIYEAKYGKIWNKCMRKEYER